MRIDRRVTDLYNEYVHASLPRREFVARLARIMGGAAAAAAVLPLLEPDYAHARQVEESDSRLTTRRIAYPGAAGDVKAYSARPRGTDRVPAVIVIHENRGLNAHIADVARRAALAGYLAIAPDGLSSEGGAPEDQELARDLFAKTDPARIASDILAAVPYVANHPESNGRVGAVGFCYGGGMALRCAGSRRQASTLRSASTGGRFPPRTSRGSRFRSCCTTPAATSGSTRGYRSSVAHSMRTVAPTASTCTRERSTAFTTTRALPGTTPMRRASRGAGPWRSSTNT